MYAGKSCVNGMSPLFVQILQLQLGLILTRSCWSIDALKCTSLSSCACKNPRHLLILLQSPVFIQILSLAKYGFKMFQSHVANLWQLPGGPTPGSCQPMDTKDHQGAAHQLLGGAWGPGWGPGWGRVTARPWLCPYMQTYGYTMI